jgi:hypothetical protein
MKWTYVRGGVYLCEAGMVVKRWTNPVMWDVIPSTHPRLILYVRKFATLQEAKEAVEVGAWWRTVKWRREGVGVYKCEVGSATRLSRGLWGAVYETAEEYAPRLDHRPFYATLREAKAAVGMEAWRQRKARGGAG